LSVCDFEKSHFDLGFSELTIAGLLGHSARGVTQRYIHLDAALVVAADQVSGKIAHLLDADAKGLNRAWLSQRDIIRGTDMTAVRPEIDSSTPDRC
jgi:hypothetical protein